MKSKISKTALIFAPGSNVKIAEDITAHILSVCMKECRGEIQVTYEVCWYDKNTRTTAWIAESEISSETQASSYRIGFK